MLFLKSGDDLYWDGKKFQPDYRKGILFGSMAGASKDLRRAAKIDDDCKLEAMNEEQWATFTALIEKFNPSTRNPHDHSNHD
jgi:hypothetical protein